MDTPYLRPVDSKFRDGAPFAKWGPHWGYHFDEDGLWVKGQVQRDGKPQGQHGGRDIVCPAGTPVRAPADGTVLLAGWQDALDHRKGFGLRVFLQFPRGIVCTLAHLSEVFVKPGDRVTRGQVVGKSGSSGNSTGPHLHVQLELAGPWPRVPIDMLWMSDGLA